jgi:ureidoglycolate lyase
MERHLQREKWVFALDKPLIQSVALSSEEQPQQPDPQSLRAFLLQPGQGVLIEAGVWHTAGLPTVEENILYGFVLGEEPDDPQENSGWIDLPENTLVKIKR